jgi:hypothetical protein
VSIDEQHVALPKLFGAPAYARPAAPVDLTPRPFDPDELPLEMEQTPEERRYASTIPARSYATTGAYAMALDGRSGSDGLQPRPFSLRAIAGRLLGGNN